MKQESRFVVFARSPTTKQSTKSYGSQGSVARATEAATSSDSSQRQLIFVTQLLSSSLIESPPRALLIEDPGRVARSSGEECYRFLSRMTVFWGAIKRFGET
jgi:hypothetical protein